MILDHVRVFTEDKKFTDGGIVIKDGRIAEVYTEGNCPATDGEEILDGQGMYAIPGLIDLHFHGCMGDDIPLILSALLDTADKRAFHVNTDKICLLLAVHSVFVGCCHTKDMLQLLHRKCHRCRCNRSHPHRSLILRNSFKSFPVTVAEIIPHTAMKMQTI